MICRYCNKKWEKNIYAGSTTKEICSKCGDTNIDIRELSKTKIDSYIGCPAFKEERKPNTQIDEYFWHGGN